MKYYSILLLFAATLLLGCDKNFESFTQNPNGSSTDTVWGNTLSNNMQQNQLYNNLQLNPFTDSILIQNGGTINCPNNAQINIEPNSFLLNGTLVDGKAIIQFYLITRKGDMIRMFKPTQSNGYLLESGGEIFIEASRYGQPLTLASGKQIKISYSMPATNPLMRGFAGIEPLNISGSNSSFNWATPNDSNNVRVLTLPNGYQVFTSYMHWINCDYFKDSAASKTIIALTMPLGFTNTNTSVFIVYKSINGVMQFDADAQNRIWVKNKVPLNKDVIFLSITKWGDDYWLGSITASTSANQHIIIKPNKIKLPDLLNYLSLL